MSDFADRPFAAGSMTGLRSFRVDGLGRLTGVVHQEVWKPGVNVGTCRKPAGDSWYALTMALSFHIPGRATVEPSAPPPVSLVKKQPHRIGQMGCSCGYYAYFDEASNPHHQEEEGNVLGVVEGYGLTTVGSRGFRCEKVRLLGLIDKPPKPLWQRVTVRGWIFGALTVGNGVIAALDAVLAHWWAAFAAAAGWGLLLLAAVLSKSPLVRRQVVSRVRTVADLYGVPVFASQAEAIAAHPLTPPPAPTPDTDPDFWTRYAS